MKIITALKNAAKKSTTLRVAMRSAMYESRKIIYKARGLSSQIDDKMIVFGSYNGRNYSCSPKAVYEYMLKQDCFSDYKFVWMFDDPEKYSALLNNRNTFLVKSQSAECEKYLNEAKYWILNFRAMDQWVPKADQVYVQCWHGTPLKRLGYDITNSDNAMNSVSEIRAKYKSDAKRFDYMVSPCNFVTEKFKSAWNLQEAGKTDAVLEIGYPRNDFLNHYTEQDIERIKKKVNLENCDKKVILYAPTWRDNQHDSAKGYVYENPVDFEALKAMLGDEYVILFKAHYLIANSFDFDAYQGFVYDVSSYDDINELYTIADILITDYSSVFFDYALLERPMVFYMYDMEEYRDEMRGFYLDVNELPGPIVKTEVELVNAIKEFDEIDEQYTKKVQAFNQEYNLMNDGNASQRLLEKII